MQVDMKNTIALVDISAIAHAIWHTSETEVNRDQISASIMARVHSVTRGFTYVAVCCDSREKTFRHDIDPQYKANRPERNAGLYFQLDRAIAKLQEDGFIVWAHPGFEADDVIATAVACADAQGVPTLVISSDKDLLQLVSDTTLVKSVRDGSIIDADGVTEKLGVSPGQVRDFITLMGDKSDNIPGASGVGKVTAAKLLKKFGSIDDIYSSVVFPDPMPFPDDDQAPLKDAATAAGLTPSTMRSLFDFRVQYPTSRDLVTLRTNVPIDFASVLSSDDRVDGADAVPEEEFDMDAEMPGEDVFVEAVGSVGPTQAHVTEVKSLPGPVKALSLMDPLAVKAIEGEIVWERQLEPRSLNQAWKLAEILDQSKLFLAAYPNAQACMTTLLAGRELGLATMASMRGFHMIDGKATLSAQLMVGLLLGSGKVEYFEMIESTDKTCTFEAKRIGGRNPVKLTHTIEMAERAGLVRPNSNWTRSPEDMLVARCSSRLAKIVAPDVLFAMYTPEEVLELREVS